MDIKQYIKRGGRRVGVLCAGVSVDDKVSFGWALCSGNHGDRFDKYQGEDIALGRLDTNYKESYDISDIPLSILSDLEPFLRRMKTYYKRNEFSNFVLDLFCEFDIIDWEELAEIQVDDEEVDADNVYLTQG